MTAAIRNPVPAWVMVTAATTAVIVVVAIRGLVRGFEPIGDNALVELRARDVLTAHHPLLGTWSSASVASGQDLNHPGPLLFDVFALPVRALGGPAGIALGAAALNSGAVWGSSLVARRLGGASTALAVAVVSAVLVWTMGSELMFDVWMPNVLVLAFLGFLVLMWAVFAGHSRALPWAVAVGSLCVQAHVSYLFLAPGLLLAGAVALILRERAAIWARHGRALVTAVVVGALAWAQPLWEQLFGAGEGNLSRLAGSSDAEGAVRNGVTLGVRMLAAVVAVPPWWARPGYDTAIPILPWVDSGDGRRIDTSGVVSLPLALAGLAVVAAAVGAAFVLARRHGDDVTRAGTALIAVTAVVAVATAAITPIDSFGVLPHKVRWLWPLGALIGAVLLGAVLSALARRSGRARPAVGAVEAGVAAVGLVLVVLAVPTYRPVAGPVDQYETWPVVRSLRDQFDALDGAGTVLFDLEGQVFAEPYTWPLMAELGRRGVAFRVASSGDARQVGESRRFTGDADTRLFLRFGPDAAATPAGATLVAAADAGTPESRVAVFTEPYVARDG